MESRAAGTRIGQPSACFRTVRPNRFNGQRCHRLSAAVLHGHRALQRPYRTSTSVFPVGRVKGTSTELGRLHAIETAGTNGGWIFGMLKPWARLPRAHGGACNQPATPALSVTSWI